MSVLMKVVMMAMIVMVLVMVRMVVMVAMGVMMLIVVIMVMVLMVLVVTDNSVDGDDDIDLSGDKGCVVTGIHGWTLYEATSQFQGSPGCSEPPHFSPG